VYTREPYYYKAKLKILAFSAAGAWNRDNCGSANKTGANLIAGSGGLGNRTDSGINWMKGQCNPPP
jgi:hypothetical protein